MREKLAPGAPVADGAIPLSVPEIRGNEWKYVKECLDTNWVSSVGPFVDRFEQMMVEYVGAGYAVATSTGTAALHIALLIAGVGPDDEVLVPTLTFVAPVNAIRYVGAHPVFVDAEPDYWQMDTGRAIDFLVKKCRWQDGELRNRATGRRVTTPSINIRPPTTATVSRLRRPSAKGTGCSDDCFSFFSGFRSAMSLSLSVVQNGLLIDRQRFAFVLLDQGLGHDNFHPPIAGQAIRRVRL